MIDYAEDLNCIETYNARRGSNSPTRLQIHMGPSPYDGDPHHARIILLMNNPGYTPGVSMPSDHSLVFDDWPLAGLHQNAPPAFRGWYQRPLGHLIRLYGPQKVSKTVCLLQLCPWASMRFDSSLVLPSRRYQLLLAEEAVQRGAVVIAGRSFDIWPSELPRVRNRLNPTLSPKGLDDCTWEKVQLALEW